MFCRFCGTAVPPESVFCARCGRRLAGEDARWVSGWVRRLRLRTPYPWAGLLAAGFLALALWPQAPPFDIRELGFSLELEREPSASDGNFLHHYLSLVVENRGTKPVREVAVELRATIEPVLDAEIVSEFRGGRFTILRAGESLPIVLVLTDEIAGGEKRRFPIDTVVTSEAPVEVTYTIATPDSGEVLAVLSTPLATPESGDPFAFRAGGPGFARP